MDIYLRVHYIVPTRLSDHNDIEYMEIFSLFTGFDLLYFRAKVKCRPTGFSERRKNQSLRNTT